MVFHVIDSDYRICRLVMRESKMNDFDRDDLIWLLQGTHKMILPYDSFIMEGKMTRNLFSHFGARSPSQLYL